MLLLALSFTHVWAQGSTSNKGTEFWTAYMDHINGVTGSTPSSMILYITSDNATTGSVDFADGTTTSIPFSVTPNNVTFVTIPASQFLGIGGQFKKGIHITAAKAIAVYAHIYAMSVSGATLLLPVNTMGKDYYSINYTQLSNSNPSYSTFVVIATEDNTTVEITPAATLTTGQVAGTPFDITLNKGELFQGLSATDLTGTHIRSISSTTGSCKKIAVFSGSSKIDIGYYDPTKGTNAQGLSSDNLFQQVYPTATWGKNFITVSLAARNYDVYRIVLSKTNTNVTLNGTVIPTSSFTNNLYYEFTTTGVTTNVISADQPIQVVQYTPTQNQALPHPKTIIEPAGDPEMIYLSPIEQGLDHVTLYSTGYYKITASYINIVIPTSAAPTFTVDGVSYASLFSVVPNNTAYSFAQIKVATGPQSPSTAGTTTGTHNLNASLPFNAIAYGFGSAESYGYAAGTNLVNLNEFVTLLSTQSTSTGTGLTSGCTNVPYELQVTIPYQTMQITWDKKDGSTPVVDNAPVLVSTTTKGTQTLYTYKYSGTLNYSTPGDYTVVATVFNAFGDDCGSNDQIEFDFNVSDVPTATFTTANSCLGTATVFADKSDPKTSTIKSWYWDFGDGQNSNVQNPTHTYSSAGDYNVTLTVVNENGCSTTSAPQPVHVSALPQAAYTYTKPDCAAQDITFTDKSTTTEGTITSWLWNFGDGTAPITKTDNNAFIHNFTATGTYTVTLQVTSKAGCVSAVYSTDILISPLPVVDFSLPDACLFDSPQFTNQSTIADGTEGSFTYLWNFGDPNATAGNPNTSTQASPTHNYSQARDSSNPYIVSLTVTSKNGCAVTTTHNFTVNGANPVAAFTLSPSNTYCSSDMVTIINQSLVSFGKVTLVKVYWDYYGDQSNYTTYQDAQAAAGYNYTHNYGLINAVGQTKNYAIKLVAYSGSATSCSGESAVQTITIKNNPVVTLSTIGTICQEAAPVQIVEDKNGFTGTGVFSGTGVSSTGLFDPAKAGPGTFTISYVFTAINSCGYSASQVITVNPAPKASAGPDLTLLEGGSVTINATASGNTPLTYKWTLANGGKAAGLNQDNILTPTASPSNNTDYMLTVTSADGCTASSTITVTVLKAPIIPSAFTPNGDGINDKWDIQYLNTYPNASVEVYNRYGTKLYTSFGYPIPWDGTYNGKDLPVGTYYYIVNPRNGRNIISGSVTIIR